MGVLSGKKRAAIYLQLRFAQALVKEEGTPVRTGSQIATSTVSLWDAAEIVKVVRGP